MDRLDADRAPSHLVARTAILVTSTPRKAAERLEELRDVARHPGQYAPGMLAQVAGEADALEAALDELHRCQRCGAALEDPVSVRRGVGPECARHGR